LLGRPGERNGGLPAGWANGPAPYEDLLEDTMNDRLSTTIGELIAEVYAAFIDIYGDDELARVGTAMLVNRWLEEPVALAA